MSIGPLRICFVAPYAFPALAGDRSQAVVGGAEVQQVFLSCELARRGYDVSMISHDFGQEEGQVVRGVTCLKTHKPTAGAIPGLRFFHPRLTKLWSALQRADADVYYQRSSGSGTGIVAAFARAHGRRMLFASAAATDFDPSLPRLRYSRDKLLYRYGVSRADQIIVQTERQIQDCRAHFGREAVRIDSCYAHKGHAARQEGVILWVGNTRPHKRPDLFLDLAERLPQFRFKLVGGSDILDDGTFSILKKRAATLSNLEMTGFVPYADVEAHFDGASMIVNTSPAEGFPNTFLQAWSRCMPSLALYDIGARIGGHHVAFLETSVNRLAERVLQLKSDRAMWEESGRRALQYVARNNSVGRVVDAYEAVVAQLAPSSRIVSA